MLHYAIVFLVIALIAAVLGFGGIAGAAAGIAKILFLVFLVLFIVSLFMGRRAQMPDAIFAIPHLALAEFENLAGERGPVLQSFADGEEVGRVVDFDFVTVNLLLAFYAISRPRHRVHALRRAPL